MTNVKRNRKKLAKIAVGVIIALVLALTGINIFDYIPFGDAQTPTATIQPTDISNPKNILEVEGELTIHMIDVGQADSFLLIQNGETALIDCGTQSAGDEVVKYLKQLSITKIDYLFATHPHEDHMGGMYDVMTSFEIGKIIMPKVKPEHATGNYYGKVLEELQKEEYDLEYATLGTTYYLGEASMKVIGQMSEPKDKNNYSTVLKVSFGETDVIFTGDAENKVEKEILKSGEYIDAEILKVGHHGSDTSTSDAFLEAISPEYALISAGIGNQFEHPSKATMKKLEDDGVIVYRTDECGTVVVTITSDDISFSCEPGDYLSGVELEEKIGGQ